MRTSLKSVAVAGATALAASLGAPTVAQAQEEPLQIALADLPEVETLFFLVGLEHAKERGLNAELTFFNGEELAIQAVLSGQADLGLGSPYAVIQRSPVPVRLFYQVSNIVFFPVVSAEIESWQDMEGKSMTVHARGGQLEALAQIQAEREGIELGGINYMPGSGNRVVALVEGHIDAAVVDLLNKNLIMEEHPDEFRVLPWVDEVVTDESLFAQLDWIKSHEEEVSILLEELLKSAQRLCENPAMIAEEREKYGLLQDLPPELANQVGEYYVQAIEAGVYSCDGGSAEDARTDISVLHRAGQLQGPDENLEVQDFWYLEPLQQAKAEVGMDGEGAAGETGGSGSGSGG